MLIKDWNINAIIKYWLLIAVIVTGLACCSSPCSQRPSSVGEPLRFLRTPQIRKQLARAALETTQQGVATSLYGVKLLTDPWGFALEEVTFEKLFLWHGQLDESVPVSLAQAMAEKLMHCTATIYPNEAHISTLVNHTADILAALVLL